MPPPNARRIARINPVTQLAPTSPINGYSKKCYNCRMFDRSEVLREVMRETDTTQTELARLSGVHQPSISQFLSAKVDLSDGQLDRLLSCMGYRLEVSRRAIAADLTGAERRSWMLHRQLSTHLTRSTLAQWRPTMAANLKRLRGVVRGQPHIRNVDRWEALLNRGDIVGLHRVLTGLDRDHIEMREVSPMSGLLSQEERANVLHELWMSN
jgi:transcriptional regulator with XRE-family HTH domain